MGMTYRNPFLEYDPEDPYREYEQEDDLSSIGRRTSRGQAGHDPGMWLQPNQTHMLERKGGGGFSLGPDPEKTQGEIKTVEPAGVEAKNATVSKLIEARRDAAQWGTEDPDSDRMLPQDIDTSNKGAMDSSAKPAEKPPGPDSPSTSYKKPSPFMADYESRKKAYDEEFGPGKTHKWYSLESTDAWERRRAAAQHDLQSARAEAEDAEYRDYNRQARPSGQAMRMLGDQGDGIYQGWTDGTFRKVGGVMDKDAHESPFLSNEITYDAETGHGFRTLRSGEMSPVMVPAPGAPPETGYGPTTAANKGNLHKWTAPPKEPNPLQKVGRNQRLIRVTRDEDGNEVTEELVGAEEGTGRGSTAKAGKSLEEKAYDFAEKAWDKYKPKNFDELEPEVQRSLENQFIEEKKADYMKRRSGGGGAAGATKTKPRQTVKIG